MLHILITDLLGKKKKKRGRGREQRLSLPSSVSLPGIFWAHKGKHTVKKTETLIQDADGQADRQMDRGKDMQIHIGSWRQQRPDWSHGHLGLTVSTAQPCSLLPPGFHLLPGCKCPPTSHIIHTRHNSTHMNTPQPPLLHTPPPPPPPRPPRRPSPQEPSDSSRDQTGGGS